MLAVFGDDGAGGQQAAAGEARCSSTPRSSSSSWRWCWCSSTLRRAPLRKYILLAASYYFYASWNAKFIALLLTLTVIDYVGGLVAGARAAGAAPQGGADLQPGGEPRVPRLLQVLQFPGGATWRWLLGRPPAARSSWTSCCRSASASTPSRACPTWWTSTAASSARCATRSTTRSSSASSRNWWPGPIVRARDFFRDLLGTGSRPSADDVSRGMLPAGARTHQEDGLRRPVRQGRERLFRQTSPPIPARSRPGAACSPSPCRSISISPATPTWPSAWRKLLGFHFPINFRRPYLAASITDFWRRWHISLSSWLRDYLYIPLGGNRDGRLAHLPQPDAHHAAGRTVARRQLEFRDLGRLPGRAALHRTRPARRRARRRTTGIGATRSGRCDVRAGAGRLGVLPRRRPARRACRCWGRCSAAGRDRCCSSPGISAWRRWP